MQIMEIIELKTGYAIKLLQGRFASYMGQDGYWSRSANGVVPFTLRQDAERAMLKHTER
jgi:hypothetical protein